MKRIQTDVSDCGPSLDKMREKIKAMSERLTIFQPRQAVLKTNGFSFSKDCRTQGFFSNQNAYVSFSSHVYLLLKLYRIYSQCIKTSSVTENSP